MCIIIATTIAINGGRMRTVQMTLEDELVKSVDQAAKKLHTTRSAFARQALKEALRNLKIKQLEHQHRQGYQAHPPTREEAGVWEREQIWGDE
jgi:metal-responsive CopG/Arc/MetJ family transcriptional regulator